MATMRYGILGTERHYIDRQIIVVSGDRSIMLSQAIGNASTQFLSVRGGSPEERAQCTPCYFSLRNLMRAETHKIKRQDEGKVKTAKRRRRRADDDDGEVASESFVLAQMAGLFDDNSRNLEM